MWKNNNNNKRIAQQLATEYIYLVLGLFRRILLRIL